MNVELSLDSCSDFVWPPTRCTQQCCLMLLPYGASVAPCSSAFLAAFTQVTVCYFFTGSTARLSFTLFLRIRKETGKVLIAGWTEYVSNLNKWFWFSGTKEVRVGMFDPLFFNSGADGISTFANKSFQWPGICQWLYTDLLTCLIAR